MRRSHEFISLEKYVDWAQWLACFPPEDLLSQHIVDPERFGSQRNNLVIVMGDLVPLFDHVEAGKSNSTHVMTGLPRSGRSHISQKLLVTEVIESDRHQGRS